jgi:hypothetical protein
LTVITRYLNVNKENFKNDQFFYLYGSLYEFWASNSLEWTLIIRNCPSLAIKRSNFSAQKTKTEYHVEKKNLIQPNTKKIQLKAAIEWMERETKEMESEKVQIAWTNNWNNI